MPSRGTRTVSAAAAAYKRARQYAKTRRHTVRSRYAKQPGVTLSVYKNIDKPPMTAFKKSAGQIPLRKFVVLRYADHRTISVSTGVPTVQSYAGNGLYDPDITNVTGQFQPFLFDHYFGASNSQAPYSKYLVHYSKITVKMYNTNSSAASACRVFLQATSDSNASTTTYEQGMMQPNASSTLSQILSSGKAVCTLKKLGSTFDMIDGNMEDADAAYTANPTALWYFHLWAIPLDEATTVSYYIDVKIDYYVECFGRNTIAASA